MVAQALVPTHTCSQVARVSLVASVRKVGRAYCLCVWVGGVGATKPAVTGLSKSDTRKRLACSLAQCVVQSVAFEWQTFECVS